MLLALDVNSEKRQKCIANINDTIAAEGKEVLGWRDVPARDEFIGV